MKKDYLLLLFVGLLTLGLTSCSDDDDNGDVMMPTGSISVDDQALEGNMLTINNLNISEDGWVVIHRDNGSGGPVVPDIISVPKQVSAGESTDVTVQLKDGVNLEDGETLWAMLHTDDGEIGMYEFDGSNGLDMPITETDGTPVMDSFMVSVMSDPTGSLTVSDQTVLSNMITVESITLDQPGWVVVHADDGGAPVVPDIISEPVYLEAGTHENVEINLNEDANVSTGDMLWVMLHTDTGTDMEYEFDGANGLDSPITEDGAPVMTSIEVLGTSTMGTFAVSDQTLTNNTVTVSSVELSEGGWVVVHADDGTGAPKVPEIISEPVYLEAGSYENVEVPLKEDANVAMGDMLFVMLHNDTGTEMEYEFDGSSGLDTPILNMDGSIAVKGFEVSAVESMALTGSLAIDDKSLSDNTITVSSITLASDGWVVVHADDGGAPMVPDIISEPVYLEAGTTEDVTITFKDDANVSAGDTVWVMLHNDTGAKGVYEFDGMNGLDLPIVVDSNIVMESIVLE